MNWSRYPDPGGLDSDRERLNFAVYFATGQRAYTLRRIYESVRDDAEPEELLFLAVDAMEEKMTAIEDTLGWVHALRVWVPSTGRTLARLLDNVMVNPVLEQDLTEYFERLDEDGLRELLTVRPADLEAAAIPETIRERLTSSIPSLLSGLRRALEFRIGGQRRRVTAFNKSKHMLQGAVFRGPDGTHAIRYVRPRVGGGEPREVAQLIATAANVRTVAAEGIVIQAVLHGVLAAILMTHYGEEYVSPEWVKQALDLPVGWHEEREAERVVRSVPRS